jgi:hypothetical protein
VVVMTFSQNWIALLVHESAQAAVWPRDNRKQRLMTANNRQLKVQVKAQLRGFSLVVGTLWGVLQNRRSGVRVPPALLTYVYTTSIESCAQYRFSVPQGDLRGSRTN